MQNIIDEGQKYLMSNYGRFPISFSHGEGCRVYDYNQREYIDFLGGVAVNILGYNNKKLNDAIAAQSQKLIHISNYFWIDTQVKLAKLLVENSFDGKAFFCNSGAEANEGAVKLARKYAYRKYGIQKNEVIAMTGSFHGRTLATLNLTDNPKYKEGFGPHPEGFKFAKFNDIDSYKQALTKNTCAVIFEPIQGEGGITPVDSDFIKKVSELCKQNDVLLIADEIQTGMGRTWKLFGYQHHDITPDIMTVAKGLAGGCAIGAVIAKVEVADAFQSGDHGSTFGGNPLACAAGVATLETILGDELAENAEKIGEYFKLKLQYLSQKYSVVKAVRGHGLMLGLELSIPGAAVVQKALYKGFLINCTATNVLRFIPPLIIGTSEIDLLIETLAEIFEELELAA